MISIRQEVGYDWIDLDTEGSIKDFWENIGIMQPLVVDTQEEYDYFMGMQLMIGKEFQVMLDGVHVNTTGLPPSYVKVDLS